MSTAHHANLQAHDPIQIFIHFKHTNETKLPIIWRLRHPLRFARQQPFLVDARNVYNVHIVQCRILLRIYLLSA